MHDIAMALFDGKCLTSYSMPIVMFALNLNICELFAKINKCQKFWPRKWRSRSKSRRTGLASFDCKSSIPFRCFFRIVATCEHTLTQTEYTHIYTARDRGDDYRQNLQSRFAQYSVNYFERRWLKLKSLNFRSSFISRSFSDRSFSTRIIRWRTWRTARWSSSNTDRLLVIIEHGPLTGHHRTRTARWSSSNTSAIDR